MRVNPDIVGKLEAFNTHLQCKETDEAYWKPTVETKFKQRQNLEPFPLLRKSAKSKINVLKATDTSDRGSITKTVAALRELGRIPMSRKLLERTISETQIGKEVGKLKKSEVEEISSLAKKLIKKWKTSLVEYEKKNNEGKFADEEARLKDQQGHIEDASNCKSWKALYECLKRYDSARLKSVGLKLNALYKKEKTQKHGIESGVAFCGERKKRSQQVKTNPNSRAFCFTKVSTGALNPQSKISQMRADMKNRNRLMTTKSVSASSTGKRKISLIDVKPPMPKKRGAKFF